MVGHVVCSRGDVDTVPVVALGPISVRQGVQRSGIGSALVHAVVAAAEATGERLVVLLGDPAYYSRFGFVSATDLGVTAQNETWGVHFQARRLRADAPTGRFSYARPFDDDPGR